MTKKYKNYIILTLEMILLIIGVGFMLGSSYDKFSIKEKSDETIRVAAVMISEDVPFWEDVWKGVRETADQSISLSEYFFDLQAETWEVTLLLESVLLGQADALIVRPPDDIDDTYEEVLRTAKKSGIQIVTVDTDISEEIRDVYIGIDNKLAAKELAYYVLNGKNKYEQIVIFHEDLLPPPAKVRMNSFLEEIRSAEPDLELKFVKLPEEDAKRMQMIQSCFEKNKGFCAVFCPAPRMALYAANTVQRMGISDRIHIYCFAESKEATSLFEQGAIYAQVEQKPYDMGRMAAEVLMESEEEDRQGIAADQMPYTIRIQGE